MQWDMHGIIPPETQRDDIPEVSGQEYEQAMIGDEMLAEMRRDRESIYGRIKSGAPGVSDLRCRLKIVTHKLLKAEVAR